MASDEGWQFYRQTVAGFREIQTAEQALLSFSALLCYHLLHNDPGEVSEPICGSYLNDFIQLLDGHELKNRREMWTRMAHSARRVATCHHHARYFLDIVIGEELPLHWLDWMSDRYWEHRLQFRQTHDSACEMTRSEFENLMAARSWAPENTPREERLEEWDPLDD